MKHNRIFSFGLILLCFAFSANGQEVAGPIYINTALHTEANRDMLRARIGSAEMKSASAIELPFIDDFSSDRFPGNPEGLEPLWTGRQATRNTSMGVNAPTIGVVTFDGADEVGYPYSWSTGGGLADTLTSVAIDLDGNAADQIGISFYYQPQGRGVFPPSPGGFSPGDSLFLEFYAPELDQWFWVWSTIDITQPEAFTFVHIPITQPRFLKTGFRFRFRNRASLQGLFSPWNIDYVRVDRNNINATPEVDDVAFTEHAFTLFEDYTQIPRSHFVLLENKASFMRDDITLEIRNLSGINRTLIGNELRILDDNIPLASFPNSNSPAISAGSTLDYTHSVGLQPNGFVYDIPGGTGPLTLDVEVIHTVADLAATASNDTMRFEQEFFTQYAYDDGSAEWSWSIPGVGSEAAMRYTTFVQDTLFAVEIFTIPMSFDFENTIMTVKVWTDTGNGPGEVLGESLKQVSYGRDDYQQRIVYTFEEPVVVNAGSFFVGYQASNQDETGISIGLDRNTNNNPSTLWFKGSNLVWTQSGIEGTTMIRPMFTSPGWETIVVNTDTRRDLASAIALYPNPARDYFVLDLPEGLSSTMSLYDISGRLVKQELVNAGEQISTYGLQDGLYIVQVRLPGAEVFSKKLVVQH